MPRADLEAAASAGIITAEQAGALDAFLQARKQAPPSVLPGEEDLRFIRNFHDVFLAIGIALLSVGLFVGSIIYIGNGTYRFDTHESPEGFWRAVIAFVGSAAIVWGLGEIFSRKRRLFLPSIAICLAFAFFTAAAGFSLYGVLMFPTIANATGEDSFAPWGAMARALAVATALGALAGAGAFYWRFRLPFSLGLLGSAFACLLGAVIFTIEPTLLWRILSPLMLAIGLLLFFGGMVFDMRDPERATRFSDNGFWLHMAAAPLILNGALGCVALIVAPEESRAYALFAGGATGPLMAGCTLLVVAVLALVSLLINRRALIVSALITTGMAVGVLMNSVGFDAAGLAASTLLTLGAGVLVLGAGWHKARAALLARIKPEGVWARVFPPESNE